MRNREEQFSGCTEAAGFQSKRSVTNGSLAGSILTLDRAVRNIVAFTELGWSEAISMATHTPARIAGVDARKGSIVPGGDADLVALDEQGFVQRTWVRGRPAYQGTSDSKAT